MPLVGTAEHAVADVGVAHEAVAAETASAIEYSKLDPFKLDPKTLKLPAEWDAPAQNAARRALEYNQKILQALEAKVQAAQGTPEFEDLERLLAGTKKDALVEGKNILTHVTENNSRGIPAVRDLRGAGFSVSETADYDADDLIKKWRAGLDNSPKE